MVGPDDADDICQQVAVRTFQRRLPFRDPTHARAWALAVARNACRDLFRRRKRSRELSLDDLEWIETATGRAALVDTEQRDPESTLLAKEQDDLLRCTVSALPARLREVAVRR